MSIIPAQSVFNENIHSQKSGNQLLFCSTAINHIQNITLCLFIIFLYGCTASPVSEDNNISFDQSIQQSQKKCTGTNNLPSEYAEIFEEIVDEPLLNRALNDINKGGLCQGKVYISKKDINIQIYRAWNSTNLNSRLGKWWAFNLPNGEIAQYRKNYEICYQFSPLDKLTRCNLKANTKIVVGTGQSVMCDKFLAYPTSETKQIYIENNVESPSLTDCKDYDGLFNWKLIQK